MPVKTKTSLKEAIEEAEKEFGTVMWLENRKNSKDKKTGVWVKISKEEAFKAIDFWNWDGWEDDDETFEKSFKFTINRYSTHTVTGEKVDFPKAGKIARVVLGR